jgi:hypothetical protein
MIWRLAILCAAIAGFGAAPKKDTANASLRRGVEFLMSQQADDGGWHSETYGSMRQGAAVTSSVVYAISHAPPDELAARKDALLRAVAFLRQGISKKGYVVNPDGSADFPTYATSMLLNANDRLKLPFTDDEVSRLAEFISDAQLTETREFEEDSVHHGGWDLMGAQRIIGQTSGTNVSISRFATEALALKKDAVSIAARARVRRWSTGIQNLPGDGGFFFTPDVYSDNNKALFDKDKKDKDIRRPRAYGTCTCDGVLLLIATGLTADDQRVAAGIKWLVDHPNVDLVPGFQKDAQATKWQQGLRYYYYVALARTLPYLPAEEATKRRSALIKVLVDSQKSDGSWENSSARMREDDPLICTSFAITALGTLLNQGDR